MLSCWICISPPFLCRPHHYIRAILPNGAVGADGRLQAGDELLEVNDTQLFGLNNVEVVKILKELPQDVVLAVARRKEGVDDDDDDDDATTTTTEATTEDAEEGARTDASDSDDEEVKRHLMGGKGRRMARDRIEKRRIFLVLAKTILRREFLFLMNSMSVTKFLASGSNLSNLNLISWINTTVRLSRNELMIERFFLFGSYKK